MMIPTQNYIALDIGLFILSSRSIKNGVHSFGSPFKIILVGFQLRQPLIQYNRELRKETLLND